MRTFFTKSLAVLAFFLLGAGGAYAQLSGSYTIDASGSGSNNYTSVAAAASALLSNGVSGPVTFTIASGTYTGQVSLSRAISGASSTNTITFKGKSGTRSDVVITNTGTYVLYMVAVDYVTFEDVTIRHSNRYGIYLNSNADYNTFDNVHVTYTGSGTGAYNVYNYRSEHNTFDGCTIEGGYYGMYVRGWNTRNGSEGCTIKNTQFYNQTYMGLYTYYTEDMVMDNMVLDSFTGYYPIYHFYGVSTTLANSKIIAPNTQYYMYWYYNNYYGGSSDTSHVYNNMIQVHGSSYAVYGYRMTRNKWYNNSLDWKGSSYGAYMPYPTGSEFVNNNWHAEGGTYGIYMYGLPAKMDYNNLDWVGGSWWGVIGTYAFASLGAQQTQYSALNPNSIDVDPEFDSRKTGDLRSHAVSLNGAGTKSWVTKDIDGNPRPATNDTKYDIGCNEYYLAPYDLDVKAIISPISVNPNGNNTITAKFRNSGTQGLNARAVAYQYSVDSGKTWSSSIADTVNNLAPGKEYDFTLTTSWNPNRTGDFRIHVKISTQVANDPDNSDETYVDVCSGLSGTYTVGRASSDFPTLADALKKLDCGLAGNVRLVLAGANGGGQATYSQLKFNDLHGTANATLTIDGQHKDSVKISHTASGFEGTIDLNNCSYLGFENMTVEHGNRTGAGVHVWNSSHHNVVKNCVVTSNNSTYYQNVGIALTGSGYRSATVVKDNLFENNTVTGQYYAISNYSSGGTSSASSGNTFKDNLVTNYYYYGIYHYYTYGADIDGNRIVNPRYRYNYPFYWFYNSNSTVQNNVIGDYYVYSLYFYRENYYSQSDTSILLNNMVNGESGYTSSNYGYGTYVYWPYNLKVWHNTFVYDANTPPTNATGTGVGAAFKAYYGANWDIQNNIFYTPMAINGAAPIFLYSPNSITAMEGNNYSHPSGIVASITGNNLSSIAALQSSLPGTNAKAYAEPVNFVGNGDYHLSTTKQNLRGANIGIATDIDDDSRCLFAPSIGADESGYPTPKTRAFFAVDDTVYINSATQFSNQAKESDPLVHNWFVDGSYVGDAVDLEYKFRASGSYTVSLISEGCGGRDSFSKNVVVVIPSNPPTAGFLTSKTIVDVNEGVTFKNITTGGADSFYWKVDSYFVRGQFGFQIKSHDFVSGTDSNATDPEIEFNTPGTYSVCLYAYNLRGTDSTCKNQLITVRATADMCGVFDRTSKLIGKLFDEGGPTGGYTANRNCNYLIDPCTDEIILTFNDFRLASGSFLRIFDGKDNSGTPLHAYDPAYANGLTGSISDATFKTTLKSTSGEVYLEFQSGNGTSTGWEMEWKGRSVNPSAPVVDFNLPDTVCAKVPFLAENKTNGLDVDYVWTMDTSAFNWFSGGDYDSKDVTHKYDTAGTYYIKLFGGNCGGADSVIKSITVVAPTTAPSPAFTIGNKRPSIGDAVQLTDASKLGNYPCISGWEWSISPGTYSFVSGYDKYSRSPQVLFSDTGCYDISLTVSNSAGSNTHTEKCGVFSISTCIPTVKITGTDVGISRVAIGNIDNSSEISEEGYENFVNAGSTDLEIGASYDITIERPAGGNTLMNRAVWVDYNQDGVFDDQTEKVLSTSADALQSWTGSFTIPASATKGSTRLRVGTNLGNFKQYGCGPNQFGEFEDYRVFVKADQQAPVIIFLGSQDTTIEQCSNWTDPGAYGWDNVDDSVGLTSTASGVNTSTPGKYTIIYKAKDNTGNEGSGERTVNVVADYTNPVLSLKGNDPMTVEVKGTYNEPGFDASDNCGQVSPSDVTVTGSVDMTTLGTYTLTYEVSDGANSTTITRTVNVVDTEAPVLTLVGNMVDTVEVNTSYTDQGVNISDNYYSNLMYDVSGSVDIKTLGEYELKYKSTDGSNNVSQEVTRTVHVVDRTAPEVVMALGSDTTVVVPVFTKYDPEYLDIDDNYYSEQSIRNTLVVGGTYFDAFGNGPADVIGDYTYTYTVEDGSGNSVTLTRNIKVADLTAPVINFGDGSVVTIARWAEYTDDDVTATDNYDNSVTPNQVENTVDKNSAGIYQVKYEATDKSGNVGTATRTVIVAETAETVGKDELSIEANLFPNPTTGVLNIQVDLAKAARTRVSVLNSLGQEVMVVTEQNTNAVRESVELSQLGSGVYYIMIVSDNEQLIKKVTLTE